MSELLSANDSYFKQSFLKDIPYPQIIEEQDYEKLLKAYEELFKSFLKDNVELLESDPFKAILEALAYREMIIRARINESIKATYLHYAKGSDLDNVVANGYLIQRLKGVKPTAKVEFELNTLLTYDVILKDNVELLESDPFKAILEALAYREMIIRARINESIKATYLHYAKGSDLDNVVANGYLIQRLKGVKPTAKVEFELNTLLTYDVIIPKGAIFSNEKADLATLKEEVVIKKGQSKAQGILELDEFIQSKESKTEFLQTPLPFVTKIKQLEYFSGGASEESDEALRERAVMSVHRFSTAGSEKGYIYHALSASAKVASIKALNNGAGKVRVIIKSEDELSVDVVKEYLSADERRPLTDEVSVELAKKREFIVDAKLLLLELSRANEISEKINALQKDFDLSVDLALGFIYKCLHQDGVYKSEILSIKEKIINDDERRPLTDEVSVELAKKREFIVDAKLLLLELSRANEISEKINALQKDFDLSVDLALGFIYKCLHQDGVYKSEILSIKEKIINEEEQELKDLPLANIIIADDEFATLSFSLSYEKAVL
ncbi:baseplate J/gp47 family protein [Campylobacter jejuni]|nr:baseplate J/gp47 family protein [Campylobacter jejuni]